MSSMRLGTFLRAVDRAWPRPAVVCLLLSFAATSWWLWASVQESRQTHTWGFLEPLAAILGGLGAFLLAMVLVYRRIRSAADDADSYGLARGLATGYYFNFLRPLVCALRDLNHPVHQQIRQAGAREVAGVVVGIPREPEDFDAERQEALLMDVVKRGGHPFECRSIKVAVAGRTRALTAWLAVSRETGRAVVLDIPSTLAVIPDFARFVAGRDGGGTESGDEHVEEARRRLVAWAERDRFHGILEEFEAVVTRTGAGETRPWATTSLVHVVPLPRMHRRMDELVGH